MKQIGWLLLGACTTGSAPLPGDTTSDNGAPAISVDQATLDFGTVSALAGEVAEQTLQIFNDGDDVLVIEDIWADDPAVEIGQLYPAAVDPQGTATLVVYYAPTQDVSTQTTLTIASNVRDDLVVDVIGEGTAPRLERSDEAVDFGAVSIGCEAEEVVTLTNTGREDLVISSVSLSARDAIELGTMDALPWTIAPADSVEVPLHYIPLDSQEDALNLVVSSNDPAEPSVSVALAGAGEEDRIVDTFSIDTTPNADILFAVDKSCSMGDDIARLKLAFGDFLSELDAGQIDYRIAMVVQNNGGIAGSVPFVDQYNSDESDDIIDEMLGGSYGDATEKAFTLLYNAMDSGFNRPGNWVRDDAALHLIGMSDEAEQSTLYTWDGYVSYFQGLKANPDRVIFHGIGGDYPTGCSTAAPYSGFYEAVIATGGGFWSICSLSFEEPLHNLSEEIIGAGSDLRLSEAPDLASITVEVDGVAISGWSLVGQSIVLDQRYEDGAAVLVQYLPAGACP